MGGGERSHNSQKNKNRHEVFTDGGGRGALLMLGQRGWDLFSTDRALEMALF
jgi:hypothetical protein